MLHLDIPTRADIESLIADRGHARVSLYLPTTPVTQQAQADRIELKNLAGEALAQLDGHDKRELRTLEEMLLDLVDDDEFWAMQANGLAVFASPAGLRTFRLPTRLKRMAEVSDRFHIKPLLRVMTVPQSAFVLALTPESVRTVEVSPDMPAAAFKVAGMPRSAADAAGRASIKERSPSGRIQGAEGTKVRLAQYARKVDQSLREFLAGRDQPLILAATEPMASIYRSVQSYPRLATTTLSTNPDAMSDSELAAAARGVLDQLFQAELADIRALYEQRKNEGRTTTDLAQAARAATYGAAQTLLVDIDEVVPGTVADDGTISLASGASAASYGVVDEVACRALLTGARVLGVRREDIPGGGSLAAILRYPV